MLYTAIKIAITAIIAVAVSEISKRSSAFGAVIASLPLTSLLAFVWLYGETGDTDKIARLSQSIFWYVLPSLILFIVLPLLLRAGLGFWPALLASSTLTFLAYLAMTSVLARLGVSL